MDIYHLKQFQSSKTGQYVVFELKFDVRENELRIECKI